MAVYTSPSARGFGMNKFFLGVAVMCAMLAAVPASGDVVANNDEEIKAISDPIMDVILAGFKTKNYSKYSKDFSESLKTQMSEEIFLKTIEQLEQLLGEYESRRYLGFLNRDGMTLVLWKSRYEKTEADVLIKLTLSRNGRKNEVEGLFFE